jgi:toxin ParE1/3/4
VAEYRFRPKARADIEGIWHYTVRTWGGPQARRYLAAIRDELWPGLRAFPSGKHVVYYLVASYGVDVVRVLHERMDPPSHLP